MRTPPVPVDAEDIRVRELRASGAPAVLVTPAHQFPTGVVLGAARRHELMRWAADGGLIVENDYDAEHRYDRPPVPALRAMLPEHVCYAGSVSKPLAPALRTGWVVAPPELPGALVDAKRFTDLGNAALPQLVLADLMETGELERRLRQLRKRHRARRDAMVRAVSTHLTGAVVRGAAAGLHLTITFDADFADTDLAAAALARGVKVQPLSWHRQGPGRPGLVLGYAASTATEIGGGWRSSEVRWSGRGAATRSSTAYEGATAPSRGGAGVSARGRCVGPACRARRGCLGRHAVLVFTGAARTRGGGAGFVGPGGCALSPRAILLMERQVVRGGGRCSTRRRAVRPWRVRSGHGQHGPTAVHRNS